MNPAFTWAQSYHDLWSQATTQMATGNDEQAVFLLRTLVATFPDSEISDDALFLLAQLLEEKRGNPSAARTYYQRILDDFPESRTALAASRRLQNLHQVLGVNDDGAVPLSLFNDLIANYSKHRHEQSILSAEAILRDYPNWQGAHQVRHWLADIARLHGELDAAQQYYEAILNNAAPRQAIVRAYFGISEIFLRQGRYDATDASLTTLLTVVDEINASERQTANELRSKANELRWRAILLQASYFVFVVMLIALFSVLRQNTGNWSAFGRALRRPPMEFFYMCPIAFLFTIMGATSHTGISHAITIISIGGLLVVWVSGIAMRSAQAPSKRHAALCASLATVATCCLCYAALFRSQLLDLIIATVHFGPE